MKRPGVIVIAVLGALLGGLLVYGLVQRRDNRSIEAAIRDGKRPAAPDHALPQLDGSGTRSLADYRGRVVVLNFWASWCTTCIQETPILERFQRTLGRRGTILGVTYKDDAADSRAFERKHGLTYPSLADGKLQLAPQYGTTALPETFVIDRRGRIVAVSRGEVSWRFLDNAVQQALRS
ncbi:MAG: cytochrome c biosis protein CcmG, thiol:disulfide interchange protein DsbE [Actinomycetota bacterium]|nr:cytochrome c biosis protein CcmG, thiol:disulfide interchange protein DsbE [Actinomycetota bacterium]